MNSKFQIAIADDHLLFAQGIKNLLEVENKMEVVNHSLNGNEIVEFVRGNEVDVVLMDLEMPEMDGFEATTEIRKFNEKVKIIALTMHDSQEFISHIMEKGANGFLSKDCEYETLKDAIFTSIINGYYMTPNVSQAMIKALVRNKTIVPTFKDPQLSEREIEIIRLLCAEKTSKEIGEALFISPRTVDGHRERILEKIGARNTVGIVMYAVRSGIV
jgi:DNA-binding NarL/FixJ family response regulator